MLDTETDPSAETYMKALVVAPEEALRESICDILAHQGLEVDWAANTMEGRLAYKSHHLVVTTLSEKVVDFVDWLRNQNGTSQPFVLGLSRNPNVVPHEYGLNDVAVGPVDYLRLADSIADARRWHGLPDDEQGHSGNNGWNGANGTTASPWSGVFGEALASPLQNGEPINTAAPFSHLNGHLPTAAHPTHAVQSLAGAGPVIGEIIPLAPSKGFSQSFTQAATATVPKARVQAYDAEYTAHLDELPEALDETPAEAGRSTTSRPSAPERQAVLGEHAVLDHPSLDELDFPFAVVDTNMCYLAANTKWKQQFHVTGRDLLGKCHYDIFTDLHPSWRELYARCLEGRTEVCEEDYVEGPDGKSQAVKWKIAPWYESEEQVGGLVLTCESQTGKVDEMRNKQLESSVAQSFLMESPGPLVVANMSGRIMSSNSAAKDLAGGRTVQDGRSFYWDAFAVGADADVCQERFLENARMTMVSGIFSWPPTEELTIGENRLIWTNLPFRNASGAIGGIIRHGVVLDQPEPAVAQPAAASLTAVPEPLFQQIAETAPFGIVLLDEESNLLYANPQHKAVLGISVEETGSMQSWLDNGLAADADAKKRAADEWWERVWRKRRPLVCTMRNAEGILKEIEFRPASMPGDNLLLAFLDVTDARREEEAMRASEARYRALFVEGSTGLAVVNATGHITDANPAFEKMAGCSRLDIRRLGLASFFPEDDAERISELAQTAHKSAGTGTIVTKVLSRTGLDTTVNLSITVVKNAQGIPVFTAYHLHPLVSEPAEPAEGTHANAAEQQPTPGTFAQSDLARIIPDLVLELNAAGEIEAHSPSRDFASILESAGEILHQPLARALPTLSDSLPLEELMNKLDAAAESEARCEFAARLEPGAEMTALEARLTLVSTEPDRRYGLVIRDLKRPAKPSAAQQSSLFAPLQNSPQAAVLTSDKGRILDVNPSAEQLFGYEKSALLGQGLFKLFMPTSPREFAQKITKAINEHKCWIEKTAFFRQDGTSGRCRVELVPFSEDEGRRGFLGLMHGLPDEEEASSPVAAASADPVASQIPAAGEASISLHRARNDLQILSSLLSMQAADGSLEESARAALQEGKDRVASVALVYRMLDPDHGTVDFANYARELGRQLVRSHAPSSKNLTVECHSQGTQIPQKLAISLGIILHELISSSLLYSFPDGKAGVIDVALNLGEREAVLVVKDNGGIHSEETRTRRTRGFGWQVVEALGEQIGATISIRKDSENEVRLSFKHDIPAK